MLIDDTRNTKPAEVSIEDVRLGCLYHPYDCLRIRLKPKRQERTRGEGSSDEARKGLARELTIRFDELQEILKDVNALLTEQLVVCGQVLGSREYWTALTR
jgi:hypothetical protein